MMSQERIKDKQKKKRKKKKGEKELFNLLKTSSLEHIKIEIMQDKVQFHRLIVCIASKFQLV